MSYGTCISGIGIYAPSEIRGNDYWSDELVKRWQERRSVLENLGDDATAAADQMHPVLCDELAKIGNDPFFGLRRRRVAPAAMRPSEMEVSAARDALASAGIRPADVDMLMSFSVPGDTTIVPNAFRLHHELGLTNASAVSVSSLCFSMSMMMDIAHQYIANGTCRHVLAVVSAKYSDIMDYTQSASVMSGDGAGALVLSRCPQGRGILASVHRTWSEHHDAMLILQRRPSYPEGVPYQFARDGNGDCRLFFTLNDPLGSKRIVASIPRWAEELGKRVLERAGCGIDDVDLLVTNAATAWYSAVVTRVLGLDPNKAEDHVLEYGNMAAANLPMNLYQALQKHRIHDGSKVLFFGHGAGATFGALLMDWV